MSDVITAMNSIVSILNVLIFIVVGVMVVVGGMRYVISAGDSIAVEAAKNTILYAIIGVVVAVLSLAIVNFVIPRMSSSASSTPGWVPATAAGFSACSVLITVLLVLRRSSRGLRWIASYSAFWMPADERARRRGERWCLLRDTGFALRLWFALTLLVASPITGWRCRRSRRRESFEVRAELESFA